jgi:hypothetical protein
MSNNIYDILKKMAGLEKSANILTEGKQACKTCGKVKCECVTESKGSKPDFLDMDKDGDKKEPMKKAVKDKAKGAVAEGIELVESALMEKYMGFKKTVAAIKKGGSADDPEAVAAAIGRKKYGKEKFQKAAAAGKKLGEDNVEEAFSKDEVDAAMTDFMKKGGRAEQLPMKKPRKSEKTDFGSKHIAGRGEAGQGKVGRLGKQAQSVPKGKPVVTAEADMEEGNKFSGNLMKARAQGLKRADLDGDGDMEPVHEGWEDMQAYLKKKDAGKQSKGGSGKVAGKRYGGAAQKDDDGDTETKAADAPKTRGRPKKDKFAR